MTLRHGAVALAMLKAAWPPARVVHVCERACVGYDVGRYTASRLVQSGDLVVLAVEPQEPGRPGRPAAVVASRAALDAQAVTGEPFVPGVLPRSFWDNSP